METPWQGPWSLIWEGDFVKASIAEDLLTKNGLEVHRQEGDRTRLFVRPSDEDTARDLFKDWSM